jgi:hypothetical protein
MKHHGHHIMVINVGVVGFQVIAGFSNGYAYGAKM